MVKRTRTIGDVQSEVAAALEALRDMGDHQLPPAILALKQIAPLDGIASTVDLEGPTFERCSKGADHWRPDQGFKATITFVPRLSGHEAKRAEPRADLESDSPRYSAENEIEVVSESQRQLVHVLNEAEQRKSLDFIGLKLFRDRILPDAGIAWATNPETVRREVESAVRRNLVITGQVPNPYGAHPTTSIRLNRANRNVQAILKKPIEREIDFRPIPIRGEPLSETIRRERR
jgi:hypothetical protein